MEEDLGRKGNEVGLEVDLRIRSHSILITTGSGRSVKGRYAGSWRFWMQAEAHGNTTGRQVQLMDNVKVGMNVPP